MIPWTTLRRLNDEHGDSFYIFNPGVLRQNVDDLLQHFRSAYPNTHIAYSYKANYLPTICESIDQMGGYAEVASGMEYDLARRIGVRPSRIIFNGPCKRDDDIGRALLEGSIVNVDSARELSAVESIVGRQPDATLRVGLRCNFDLGTGQISRFGFDADGPDLTLAFERLDRLRPGLVIGLHCHAMMPGYAARFYAVMTERLLELAHRLFRIEPPQFLDIGGGFASRMPASLADQFGHEIPTWEAYADAVAPQLARAYGFSNGPELLLEPGLALTANAMQFVTRVIDTKTIRSRRVAMVAGSIYDIRPTLHDKQLPAFIVSARPPRDRSGVTPLLDIVGHTCLEHDCLYAGFTADISTDDYLVVGNVGAYTTVLRPAFMHPNPAIISHDPISGEFELLRPQRTFAEVWGRERS